VDPGAFNEALVSESKQAALFSVVSLGSFIQEILQITALNPRRLRFLAPAARESLPHDQRFSVSCRELSQVFLDNHRACRLEMSNSIEWRQANNLRRFPQACCKWLDVIA